MVNSHLKRLKEATKDYKYKMSTNTIIEGEAFRVFHGELVNQVFLSDGTLLPSEFILVAKLVKNMLHLSIHRFSSQHK